MKLFFLFFFFAAFQISNLAYATVSPLFKAKALICTAGPGVSTQWTDGIPTTKPSQFDTTFRYSEIDLKKGTAHLFGAASSAGNPGVVSVLWTPKGMTFIEITNGGGVFITTVYATMDAKFRYPLVDTRHNAILGEPIPSQYYGLCQIEN